MAVACSLRHRVIPRNDGDGSAHSAAHPATCGVAMLVPLMVAYFRGMVTEEKTSRPGPAISILPKLENDDGLRSLSSAATDMIVGELAGAPVFELALPAAAMIRQPLLSADVPAAVYAACTGACDPSDIEITAHRFAIAQFIPARTPAVLPEPVFDSTGDELIAVGRDEAAESAAPVAVEIADPCPGGEPTRELYRVDTGMIVPL